jgi:hypothetical protein
MKNSGQAESGDVEAPGVFAFLPKCLQPVPMAFYLNHDPFDRSPGEKPAA